jgi:sec-independent protein translocase protein TatA
MPNIGPMEIILVLIVALIVFGPKKLPELGKSLGKSINEFKGSIGGDNDHETPTTPAAIAEPTPVAAAPVAVAPVTSHRVEEKTQV